MIVTIMMTMRLMGVMLRDEGYAYGDVVDIDDDGGDEDDAVDACIDDW